MRLFQQKPSDSKVEEVKPIEEELAVVTNVPVEEEVKPAAAADEMMRTEENVPSVVNIEKQPEEIVEVEATSTETESAVSIDEPIVVVAQEAAPPAEEETTIPAAVQVPSDEASVATEVAPTAIEGDLGQGNLEDKELYTTREWLYKIVSSPLYSVLAGQF